MTFIPRRSPYGQYVVLAGLTAGSLAGRQSMGNVKFFLKFSTDVFHSSQHYYSATNAFQSVSF